MKRNKRSGRHYGKINGQPRNVAVRLTADELAAMASELQGTRNMSGMSEFERRLAHVRKNAGG